MPGSVEASVHVEFFDRLEVTEDGTPKAVEDEVARDAEDLHGFLRPEDCVEDLRGFEEPAKSGYFA